MWQVDSVNGDWERPCIPLFVYMYIMYIAYTCKLIVMDSADDVKCTYQYLAPTVGVRAYPGAIDIFHYFLSTFHTLEEHFHVNIR